MTFDKNQTVREIAIKKPAAVRVFESFQIDYCCGGKGPLQQACQRANAAIDKVLQALDKLETSNIAVEERQWTQCSLADLTAHIVGRYHRYARDKAPRIEELLQKVVNRLGDAHPELGAIQETFSGGNGDRRARGADSAARMFRIGRDADQPDAGGPRRRRGAAHQNAGSVRRPSRAGWKLSQRSRAVQALEEFERDLHRHIHLENNILFPRATEIERSLQETTHVLH